MENILVVDDDKDLLSIIKRMLTVNGYKATTLTDGNLVFKTLKESVPDLVVLDINLGVCDGREICRRIKESQAYGNIPVILYSAEKYQNQDLVKYKANGFIHKPFPKSLFLEKIRNLLAA
jgi:DNA-binding response OmpR family regulator